MIAVVCAAMVIAALSLSLLLSAASLLSAGRQSFAKEQCRIMAESVSRQVDGELADKFYFRLPDGIPEDESLWGYAGALPGEEGEKKIFRLDGENNGNWPQEAGWITLSLSWEWAGGAGGAGRAGAGAERGDFWEKDLDLYVEITCGNKEGAYTITNIYHKVNGEKENSWKWSGLAERE